MEAGWQEEEGWGGEGSAPRALAYGRPTIRSSRFAIRCTCVPGQ
jgi:hypothetical protein